MANLWAERANRFLSERNAAQERNDRLAADNARLAAELDRLSQVSLEVMRERDVALARLEGERKAREDDHARALERINETKAERDEALAQLEEAHVTVGRFVVALTELRTQCPTGTTQREVIDAALSASPPPSPAPCPKCGCSPRSGESPQPKRSRRREGRSVADERNAKSASYRPAGCCGDDECFRWWRPVGDGPCWGEVSVVDEVDDGGGDYTWIHACAGHHEWDGPYRAEPAQPAGEAGKP